MPSFSPAFPCSRCEGLGLDPGQVGVRVNWLVVWHTPSEFARLWAGVDRKACLVLR
jgi:hypothetical protein